VNVAIYYGVPVQVEDATVAKYLDMGHSKEAIQYGLQMYGDDQTKVGSFYSLYHCYYLMFPIEHPYHSTDGSLFYMR